jgi:carboxyl-terminal processing protease
MLMTNLKRAARIALLSLCAFAGGVLAFGAVAVAKDPSGTYRKLEIFSRVLSYVENNYVEETDEEKLVYGAIKGMLETLDPHTIFMDPQEYRAMKEDTDGEFGGVGLEVAVKDDHFVVVAPISDTPAARAGLRAGDRILKIDAAPTRGMSLPEVTQKLKGAPGTRVTLSIMRDGFSEARDVSMIRDSIRVVSVESRLLEKQYGYVKLKNFQDRSDQYVKKALDDLRKQKGSELKGVILDLRNNPGGLLDQAVRIADRFLSEGVIVTTKGRKARHVEEERAHPRDTEPAYPLILLVNAGSASASEIVAGALQDHGRAVLMGTQTFGKGSVQTVIELEDGSGLKLTIARYYTPSGRSIQEKGITPDVVVKESAPSELPDEQTREKDLKGHFAGEPDGGGSAKPAPEADLLAGDFQLKTALDYLKSWEIFKTTLAPGTTPRAASRE